MNFLLAFMVCTQASKPGGEVTFGMSTVIPIWVGATLALIASFVLPKFLAPKARSAAEEMRGPDPQWDKDAKQKRFTAFVVSMAMADAVGVMGFVLGIGTNSFENSLPLFAASTISMIIHAVRAQDQSAG